MSDYILFSPHTHSVDSLLTCLQLIELWETFLLQLDAGDEGNPFYAAPGAAGNASAESAQPEHPETAPVAAAEDA